MDGLLRVRNRWVGEIADWNGVVYDVVLQDGIAIVEDEYATSLKLEM